MKILQSFFAILLTFGFLSVESSAQQKPKLGENAALRYWAAFFEMQDWATTSVNAKELSAIVDGSAPYDDLKYKELVAKNEPALREMQRGTTLPNCDWGLDYELGPDTPVGYVHNALQLGRLNVLYAFHQMINNDKDGAVRTLAAGRHFAHDVANGGPRFAALVSKNLLESHFRVAEFAMHSGLSAQQQIVLRKAIAQLGPEGLDWEAAIRREMAALNRPSWKKDIPIGRVTQAYINVLKNPAALPQVQQLLAGVPMPSREVLPHPQRIIEEKQDFEAKLQQARAALLK